LQFPVETYVGHRKERERGNDVSRREKEGAWRKLPLRKRKRENKRATGVKINFRVDSSMGPEGQAKRRMNSQRGGKRKETARY